MINRLLFAGIVVFWLTMTTLLVRMQISPGDSALREIPPAHILRVMFEHGQASDLNVNSGGMRYGSVVVRPTVKPDGQRFVFFGGSALLRANFLPRDRLSVEGRLTFDDTHEVSGASGTLTLREAAVKLSYAYDRAGRTFAYTLHQNDRVMRSDTIALDRAGLGDLLRSLDVDPVLLDSTVASAESPRLTAYYTKFRFRDESVDAYSLVLKRGSTTLGEVYVSQLGQILSVATPFGLQLAPSELLP